MKAWNILALSLALLASSACGNKNHLTDDQKAQLSDTATSFGRAASTTSTASSAQKHQQPGGPLSYVTADMASIPSVDPMHARLQEGFDKEQCKVNTLSAQDPGASPGSGASGIADMHMNVQVTGAQCPVLMDVEFGANGAAMGGKLDVSVKMNYQVQDTEYRSLNDVDGMSFSGSIGIAQAGMDLNISGKIHSQKNGDIPIKVTGNMAMTGSGQNMSASGSVDVTIQFPSFTADLKQEINGSQIKYSINDEEVSKDEFMGYFSKAGINSTSLSSPSPAPGGMGPKY